MPDNSIHRQLGHTSGPMTPITPAFADKLQNSRLSRQRRLLPSAFEMTPPQSIPSKANKPRKLSSTIENELVEHEPTNPHQQLAFSPYTVPLQHPQTPNFVNFTPGNNPNYARPLDASPVPFPEMDMNGPVNTFNAPNSAPAGSPFTGTPISNGFPAIDPRYPPNFFSLSTGMSPLNVMNFVPVTTDKYGPNRVVKQPRSAQPSSGYNMAFAGGPSMGSVGNMNGMAMPVSMPFHPGHPQMAVPRGPSHEINGNPGILGTPNVHNGGINGPVGGVNTDLELENETPSGDIYEAYNNYILRQAGEEKSKVIWPPEIEVVFMEAIWLIPGTLRKITVQNKNRGRNELVADFISTVTNKLRTRKQVSSHLQVLKKLLKDDHEFLETVGPKLDNSSRRRSRSRGLQELEVESETELVERLRELAANRPKPRFLVQAEHNINYARTFAPLQMDEKPQIMLTNPQGQVNAMERSTGGPMRAHPVNVPESRSRRPAERQATHSASFNKPSDNVPPNEPTSAGNSPLTENDSDHSDSAHTDTLNTDRTHEVLNENESLGNIQRQASQYTVNTQNAKPVHSQPLPPLKHPKPVNIQERRSSMNEDFAESNLPFDFAHSYMPVASTTASFSRQHKRTISANVELLGDKVLPSQFVLFRKDQQRTHCYSRLLRACYESPSRPLQLSALKLQFPEILPTLKAKEHLNSLQIIHGTVSLDVKPVGGHYDSDVQFMITKPANTEQSYRYIVKTVISSRQTELLNCENPCFSSNLSGRGFEQDKELLNIPFISDFWSEFLGRIESSDQQNIDLALRALSMSQTVYRKFANGLEEPCCIALYKFMPSENEFSARTRFRRVVDGNLPAELYSPLKLRNYSVADSRVPASPKLNIPSNVPNFHMHLQQPVSATTTNFPFDSPNFQSPKRIWTTQTPNPNQDFGNSPFVASQRGSPRVREIPRSMTAFEPLWDDFPDWVGQ